MYPSYLNLYDSGELRKRAEEAQQLLASCSICPRQCKVNRHKDERGICKTGLKAILCSYMPHHGEEPPISGERGSGAIFFSLCNMGCVYCQNYEFSQQQGGREVEPEELARYMLELQTLGCHNINLVTPTHVMPQILQALLLAVPLGLRLPIVYNTGGYELTGILKILDGIVDIYLPDMRYGTIKSAQRYSCVVDYPRYNQEAMEEMHRQVGIAEMDNRGIIRKGVIVRHLVLPNAISGTKEIMKFLSAKISKETYISLMSQYAPYYKAPHYKELNRRISHEEYTQAQALMEEYGLHNGWMQESRGLQRFAGVHIKKI